MSIRANVPKLVFGICLVPGILAFLACEDEPLAPESRPSVLTVEPTHQWAGGEVRITIVGFPFEDEDVVVAGEDTLEVFDRQLFLLGVRLPTDANGPTTLEMIRDGEGLGSVTVEAYGFEEHRTYPVDLAHYITEYPVEWGVAVVGPAYFGSNGDTSLGITWIHPSSGVHRQFAGTPEGRQLYRTGVDPISGDLYYEWETDCTISGCPDRVHVGKIIGGELIDLGWVSRPCHRWGCEPLAADIWVQHELLRTCRVVGGPVGDSCIPIDAFHFGGDDPQWIRRLWSADVALIEHTAFQISTGLLAFRIDVDHQTGGFREFEATTDEGREVFYVSNWGADDVTGSPMLRIRTLRGEDGSVIRSVELPLGLAPEEALRFPGPSFELAHDSERDVILIHRTDQWTLEARDPITLALKGEIALPDHPDGWMEARVLVDQDTDRAFIVYSAGWKDGGPTPGTPVTSIRLPPP
jgi:hypothetical protein